jgi:hypothetical protein
MSKNLRMWMLAGMMASIGMGLGQALAADVTLDMNGFPNLVNGQVTGGDLKEAIPMTAGKEKVELKGLNAGQTYSVDFFHNSGEDGSDFTITMNEAGTGVASVAYANAKLKMLKDFKPGATTLTLDTHKIEIDPEGKQTAFYYIQGLCATLPPEPGPQKFTAMPGIYSVDYLTNNALGAEDFTFIVDQKGDVKPGPKSEEFIECVGNKVKPRTALVHFKIEASSPVLFHPTHKLAAEVTTVNEVTTFDMVLPVGGGGVNVWSFGVCKVMESDAMGPDGKPLVGFEANNDMIFQPRLRWDEKTGFYFDASKGGKAKSVFSKVNGMSDGDLGNLTVTVTATIADEKKEEKKAAEKK